MAHTFIALGFLTILISAGITPLDYQLNSGGIRQQVLARHNWLTGFIFNAKLSHFIKNKLHNSTYTKLIRLFQVVVLSLQTAFSHTRKFRPGLSGCNHLYRG
jgi:hypothetical protein